MTRITAKRVVNLAVARPCIPVVLNLKCINQPVYLGGSNGVLLRRLWSPPDLHFSVIFVGVTNVYQAQLPVVLTRRTSGEISDTTPCIYY
jgi:hypothetical protein